uniref:Rho GTPase activating protein 20 n=1 Tax=Pavo cristatus TaxID=9049 RepID=A0A8C9FSE4_PAVCR
LDSVSEITDNRDQDNRSRESVFTLSDGDSEQTEVDEIQNKTKSKQLTISVDVHRKFSSQENSEKESLCSSALGFTSATTSGVLKTLRRHRRSSEPAIGLLAPSFVRTGDGHEKAARKASCDVVLSYEDEDYLHQLRSLQMEGQKLINQSLIIGINVGKSDNANQNVEKKDLSHCLLPPTPEGLNICSGFSSSSLSSPGTSPSLKPTETPENRTRSQALSKKAPCSRSPSGSRAPAGTPCDHSCVEPCPCESRLCVL